MIHWIGAPNDTIANMIFNNIIKVLSCCSVVLLRRMVRIYWTTRNDVNDIVKIELEKVRLNTVIIFTYQLYAADEYSLDR